MRFWVDDICIFLKPSFLSLVPSLFAKVDKFLRSMNLWVDEFLVDDICRDFEDFSSLTRPTLICFHSWWQQCNFYLIWILMRLFTQASKKFAFSLLFFLFSILRKWMEEFKLKAHSVLHFPWNFLLVCSAIMCITIEMILLTTFPLY